MLRLFAAASLGASGGVPRGQRLEQVKRLVLAARDGGSARSAVSRRNAGAPGRVDRHGDGAVCCGEPQAAVFRAPCGMRHYGRVRTCGEDVRDALVRQWQAIATALPAVDLDVPSRVGGWRNREVVAHLCLQLVVLRRFVATASMQHAMAEQLYLDYTTGNEE